MATEVLSALQVATIRAGAAGEAPLSQPRAGLDASDMRHVGGMLLTLADSHESLRALVGELLIFAEKYAMHSPSWCKAGDHRTEQPCTCGLTASESVLVRTRAVLE